jgi:hypothetical protein
MASALPATIDDLGLQGSLSLWALLTAQNQRRPIAPTRRMTGVALSLLCEHGIIAVPWPEPRWSSPVGAQETPIEGLQWRLAWRAYEPDLLVTALEEYFATIDRDDLGTAMRLRMWTDLGCAEAEVFFEQQLIKHHFDPAWAQDIAFAFRELKVDLSIAQWRYCGWAAVRHGASVALQHGLHAEGLRESIYQEVRRRACSLSSNAWTGCAFPPRGPLPDNALGRGFTQHLARLGMRYWTEPPNLESLLGAGLGQSANA